MVQLLLPQVLVTLILLPMLNQIFKQMLLKSLGNKLREEPLRQMLRNFSNNVVNFKSLVWPHLLDKEIILHRATPSNKTPIDKIICKSLQLVVVEEEGYLKHQVLNNMTVTNFQLIMIPLPTEQLLQI